MSTMLKLRNVLFMLCIFGWSPDLSGCFVLYLTTYPSELQLHIIIESQYSGEEFS